MSWEYMMVEGGEEHIVKLTNKYTKDGWEPFAVTGCQDIGVKALVTVHLKRRPMSTGVRSTYSEGGK